MRVKEERRHYKKALPYTVTPMTGKPDLNKWYADRAEKSHEKQIAARERAIKAFVETPKVLKIVTKPQVIEKTPLFKRLGHWLLNTFLNIKFN